MSIIFILFYCQHLAYVYDKIISRLFAPLACVEQSLAICFKHSHKCAFPTLTIHCKF